MKYINLSNKCSFFFLSNLLILIYLLEFGYASKLRHSGIVIMVSALKLRESIKISTNK